MGKRIYIKKEDAEKEKVYITLKGPGRLTIEDSEGVVLKRFNLGRGDDAAIELPDSAEKVKVRVKDTDIVYDVGKEKSSLRRGEKKILKSVDQEEKAG